MRFLAFSFLIGFVATGCGMSGSSSSGTNKFGKESWSAEALTDSAAIGFDLCDQATRYELCVKLNSSTVKRMRDSRTYNIVGMIVNAKGEFIEQKIDVEVTLNTEISTLTYTFRELKLPDSAYQVDLRFYGNENFVLSKSGRFDSSRAEGYSD